jgi:hypothetical protein
VPTICALVKSAISMVTLLTSGTCRSNPYREIHSGAALITIPMPLIEKYSAASWCRSRPPRVRKDHSRLST